MAFIDARGAELSYSVAASSGINDAVTITDDGVARDLTGITVAAVLKDDEEQASDYGGEYGTTTQISMSLSDAENGIISFVIAPSYFTNKEGGRLSYECYQVDSGAYKGLFWGYIDVLERG